MSCLPEPLSHGGSRERCEVLQRGGFGSGSGDDNGVLEGVVLFQSLDELGHGRSLLTNSNVNTVELLDFIVSVVPPLLVKDGVEGNSGLSGLTVTNDKFTLPSVGIGRALISTRLMVSS